MQFATESEMQEHVLRMRSFVSKDFGGEGEASLEYQNIEMRDGYYLNCWRSGAVYMHYFKRKDRKTSLLEVNLGGGSRSAIAKDGTDYYLLRATRALASGQRLEFVTCEIEGQEFYVIGEIGVGVGEAILDFYLSGTLVYGDHPNDEPDDDDYGDLGPNAASWRRPCVVIPQHHKVAVAAANWLRAEGYERLTPYTCRPDFYVSRDNKRYVVEVKPSASLQNAALALGQLAIYSKKLNNAGKIAVFPKNKLMHSHDNLSLFDPGVVVVYV
jgi:hypothetical protein